MKLLTTPWARSALSETATAAILAAGRGTFDIGSIGSPRGPWTIRMVCERPCGCQRTEHHLCLMSASAENTDPLVFEALRRWQAGEEGEVGSHGRSLLGRAG